VPVHRVEPVAMIEDDDQTGVIRPGEDHRSGTNRVDP
jgi:hypothetical protein